MKNRIISLLKSLKSEEALILIEENIDSTQIDKNEFEKLRKKWTEYDMGIYLKIYREEEVINFLIEDFLRFSETIDLPEKSSFNESFISEKRLTVEKEKADNEESSSQNKTVIQSGEYIYKIANLFSIGYLYLSFTMFYNTFMNTPQSIFYLFFIVTLGIWLLILGVWGLIIPYIQIINNRIIIKPKLVKTIKLDISEIREFTNEGNKIKLLLQNYDSVFINKKLIKRDSRNLIDEVLKKIIT